MLLPKPADAIHRGWMYRLITAIADDPFLVSVLRFKGGTYAAMRGILDRFSVDLDFDLIDINHMAKIRQHMEKIFKRLDLSIHDQSRYAPQYFLKYPSRSENRRCTLRVDVSFPPPKANDYEAVRLPEIDRIVYGHTIPTMFANKLVAVIKRYETHRTVAGRDIFDIHEFFLKAYSFKHEIIEEMAGKSVPSFLKHLCNFIETHVTQEIIDEDLNWLLPADQFRSIRTFLKQGTLICLRDELQRLEMKS